MTETIAYDRVGKIYDVLTFSVEWFVSKHRKEILLFSKGLILEVGFGTGNSIKDYPPNSQVVAIEVSRGMLKRAAFKLKDNKRDFELILADIGYLPFRDEAFDTLFSSLVMCAASDPISKLQEMRRVTKNESKLLMIEHVKSKNRVLGYWMDKANPLVVSLDNINRDTVENLKKAGWSINREKNLAYDILKAIIAESHKVTFNYVQGALILTRLVD
jgi:ubiquinone/menaquinone biosynthesis C-methylase UbiE